MRFASRSDLQRDRRSSAEEGTALIWFIMMSFALFAIAALVSDLGAARLSQRMMQNAADFAAVDGLRSRDRIGNPMRSTTADAMTAFFDDDLDPMTADGSNITTGPTGFVTGGQTGVDALGQLNTAPLGYRPAIETNSPNMPEGDMVSGNYQVDMPSTEGADYVRQDFVPEFEANPLSNSLLVRLRRTSNPNAFDQTAGVSSNAPPLPALFSRGALVGGQFITRGITVRATAIADGQDRNDFTTRVKSVGHGIPAGDPGGPLLGVMPVAVSLDTWEEMPNMFSGQLWVAVFPDGRLLRVHYGFSLGGWFVQPLPDIGMERQPMAPNAWVGDGYIPIYDNIDGIDRVIGFGYADVRFFTPTGNTRIITRLSQIIAWENASAVPSPELATLLANIAANNVNGVAIYNEILTKHQQFEDSITAPVLIR